ncbi:MAG: hypothetical protein Q8N18_17390 [Opitutaceae bacterium]|nr:hypothetical protein [Opitutaceae bacterium]
MKNEVPYGERATALRKHDFYVYDLGLHLKWSPSGEDILQHLCANQTFIVDSCAQRSKVSR